MHYPNAVASGELPAYAAPIGFGDLNGTDVGAVEQKDSLKLATEMVIIELLYLL